MGRHDAPDNDGLTVPILRMPAPRAVRSQERPVAGVAFPIVDDLSLIASDDRLLDALAAGRTEFDDLFVMPASASSGYVDRRSAGNVRAVAPLLALWRAHVVDPPMPPLPELAVPRRAMRAPADRRRSLRPMLAAAAAICALLMGSTAVGAQSARPGDALWGLTQVLYSDRALSLEAQERVHTLVSMANKALDNGDTDNANSLLISARGQVEQVLPTDGKENLERDVVGLQVKLQTRKSSAEQSTSAGSSPGRLLNAVTPVLDGIAATSSSSSQPAAAVSPPVAAAAAPTTTRNGSATSAAPNPILQPSPVPVPTLQPTTPPVAPVTEPPAVTVTVTSPTSTPPVDPTTTAATATTPSVPDSTTSVVIAPTTTTPSATDPVTPASTDPASTDSSTTSVMPTPSPTDTASSVLDLSGVAGAPTTGTGP